MLTKLFAVTNYETLKYWAFRDIAWRGRLEGWDFARGWCSRRYTPVPTWPTLTREGRVVVLAVPLAALAYYYFVVYRRRDR